MDDFDWRDKGRLGGRMNIYRREGKFNNRLCSGRWGNKEEVERLETGENFESDHHPVIV